MKENIQYNTISLSSLGENYSQIFALFNSAIVEEEWFTEYDLKHYSLENKLIKLNMSFIQKYEKGENWNNDYVLREEEILYFYNDLEQ